MGILLLHDKNIAFVDWGRKVSTGDLKCYPGGRTQEIAGRFGDNVNLVGYYLLPFNKVSTGSTFRYTQYRSSTTQTNHTVTFEDGVNSSGDNIDTKVTRLINLDTSKLVTRDMTKGTPHTWTVDIPNDITCNVKTGDVSSNGTDKVPIYFSGKIATGDSITLTTATETKTSKITEDVPYFIIPTQETKNATVTYTHKDAPAPTYNISWELYNGITVSPKPTSVTGGSHTFTFTPPEGYRLTSGGIYNQYTDQDDGSLIISADKLSGTLTVNVDSDITITASAEEIPATTYVVQTDLKNCSSVPANGDTVPVGPTQFTFTADPGYYFPSGGHVENPYTGMIEQEFPGSNTTTLTASLGEGVVTLTAEKRATEITLTQNLTNATSDLTGSVFPADTKAITLTATPGFSFNKSVQVVLKMNGGSTDTIFTVAPTNTGTMVIPFGTDTNNTITSTCTGVSFTVEATQAQVTGDGFLNVYAPTYGDLSALSNEQIYQVVGSSDIAKYDVSKYITSIREIPFAIPQDLLTSTHILVGKVKAETQTNHINAQTFDVDGGTITIPEKHGNAYDYTNTTVSVYLPYTDPVSVNVSNAINKTIAIKYHVDLLSGTSTIELLNDDNAFYTKQVKTSNEVPFLNNLFNTIQGTATSLYDNHVLTPYALVTRATPVELEDYYPTLEQGTLKKYSGRVKATIKDINNSLDMNVLSDINNLLSKGVVIK